MVLGGEIDSQIMQLKYRPISLCLNTRN
uniref:Uncharacterized protein n=1 Tax=Ciona intestinalis TaxID=7719 RepID=H2XRR4_CIOIN